MAYLKKSYTCLDTEGGLGTAGAKVIVNDCKSASRSQLWLLSDLGTGVTRANAFINVASVDAGVSSQTWSPASVVLSTTIDVNGTNSQVRLAKANAWPSTALKALVAPVPTVSTRPTDDTVSCTGIACMFAGHYSYALG